MTPIPVTLDGKRHTVTRDLDPIAASAPKGTTYQLQIISSSKVWAPQRTAGTLDVTRAKLVLPTVKVGDTLPEKVIPLTRGDLVNYAGVSGDLNPIHWDDDIAKQVGLDTAIAHGMLTMGLGGGYVTSWVGDPAAVTEYNVRFTAVVPVPNDGVGAEIVFNGRVKSVEADTKSVTIALTATSGGKKIFGRAVATAKLA